MDSYKLEIMVKVHELKGILKIEQGVNGSSCHGLYIYMYIVLAIYVCVKTFGFGEKD